jgi:hypothetical protein
MMDFIEAHAKDCREDPILSSLDFMESNLEYIRKNKPVISSIVDVLQKTDFVEMIMDGVPCLVSYNHLRNAYNQYNQAQLVNKLEWYVESEDAEVHGVSACS